MGLFSTPKTNANLKKEALAAYSKLEHLEDRQKVGEQFIADPTINGYIFNPSVMIKARRLKQQYNKGIKGENIVTPEEYGKEYFGIGKKNNDPDGGEALESIAAQFGTPVLGLRMEHFIEKEMMLPPGEAQDIAYGTLLKCIKALPKRNNSVDAELDNLFNKMGKNVGKFFGGNTKKNHKRHRKTKKARRTRRNNKKRSA